MSSAVPRVIKTGVPVLLLLPVLLVLLLLLAACCMSGSSICSSSNKADTATQLHSKQQFRVSWYWPVSVLFVDHACPNIQNV